MLDCVRLSAVRANFVSCSTIPPCFVSERCCENKTKVPLLILGGGGYNDVNAARTFTTCTVASVEGVRKNFGRDLMPTEIPESDPFYARYSENGFLIHTHEEMTNVGGTEVTNGIRECLEIGRAHV